MKRAIVPALISISVLLVSCDNGEKATTSDETAPPAVAPAPEPVPEQLPNTVEYVPVDNPTWGRALIAGQKDHLVKFEAKFRELSGLNDADAMAEKQIGCTGGCADLATGTPSQLEYVFPREYPNIVAIFGQAWDVIQAEVKDADFSLTFKADIATKDCSQEVPQPCYYMPYCPGDRCGNLPNPPCNRC